MLYQLSRIPITKMIFEIEKTEKIGKNQLHKNPFKNQRKSFIISSCFGSSKQNSHYKLPQFLVGELSACLPLPQQGKAFKGKVAAITTTITTANITATSTTITSAITSATTTTTITTSTTTIATTTTTISTAPITATITATITTTISTATITATITTIITTCN
ncbi:hypothetical protein EDC96DRAFT_581642 [Choanephora cucurbitarum]|nr:hypothetical protein EDC96DRAFT_581642 [Choanephora cucurbitarum]